MKTTLLKNTKIDNNDPLYDLVDKTTFELLAQCELDLSETALIARNCTEYKSSALKNQCRDILKTSKKVHRHLVTLEAALKHARDMREGGAGS